MSKRNPTKISRRDYQSYMNSEEWQQVRQRYWKSKLAKCCFCCHRSDVPLDLHHISYKTLGIEKLIHLRPVCRECHDKIHKLQRENGLTVWVASKKIQKWARRKRRKAILANAVLPTLDELDNRKNWTRKNLHAWGILHKRKGWYRRLRAKILRRVSEARPKVAP